MSPIFGGSELRSEERVIEGKQETPLEGDNKGDKKEFFVRLLLKINWMTNELMSHTLNLNRKIVIP